MHCIHIQHCCHSSFCPADFHNFRGSRTSLHVFDVIIICRSDLLAEQAGHLCVHLRENTDDGAAHSDATQHETVQATGMVTAWNSVSSVQLFKTHLKK